MKIIGITGTLGAGKGTIVEYLVEKKNFRHFSVRAFLIKEINKLQLPVNRDSMVQVANDLRAKYSPSYIVEALFEEAKKSGQDCIIESIRTPGEVQALQGKGNFQLLAIDADAQLRYDRIALRKSETDMISFETFVENEKREMESDDPSKQNLKKCMQLADVTIRNDGDLSQLEQQLEKILN